MKRIVIMLLLMACKKTTTYTYVGIPGGTAQNVTCGKMGATWLCVHGDKSYQCAESANAEENNVISISRVCAAYVPMLPNGNVPPEKP